MIEAEYGSPDKEIYIMPDGKHITIGNNAIDIFHKLQRLPTSYKLTLLNVSDVEVIDYLNLIYKTKSDELKEILNKKWIWRETGERMYFNYIDENIDVLGISLTKKQIMSRLQRKTLSCQDIVKILDHFSNQYELTDL